MSRLSRFFVLLLSLMVMYQADLSAQSQTAPAVALTAEQWRKDLDYLAAEMILLHKSLFHTVSESEFQAAVRKLDADIPALNADQILVRLAGIGALIQDGHSGLSHPFGFDQGEKVYIPVWFAGYPDGIYVTAAAPEYAEAVGGKLVAVGKADVEAAMKRVETIVSHDPENNGHRRAWVGKTYLNCPRFLHGLGLADSADQVEFQIEKDGKRRSFIMRPSVSADLSWFLEAIPPGWAGARPAGARIPLSYQHPDKYYWFEYLAEKQTVFFQFNAVLNQPGTETLAEFASRLGSAIQQEHVQRLVIDVRFNSGGDNTLLRPLLTTLYRCKLTKRGGLFVIIGPKTFSAAQNFVNRLENYTDPIFVGEPTGENVNFYGDASDIQLPNSGLHFGVSHLWWQDKDPRDNRVSTDPEIAVEITFQDYLSGKDPVLDAALTAPVPATIGETLSGCLQKGLDALLGCYDSWVKDPARKFAGDPERAVNGLGYQLLAAGRIGDALLVFQANVERHPDSSNAYDSLGEAYARAKENARALEAYRRSLELNPDNSGARRMIQQLENAKP